MAVKIQLRRDTAANWTSANPTLSAGEAGFETDTSKLKIGDGSTAWSALAYFAGGGGGVSDHGALTGLTDDDHAQYHTDARANAWLGTKTTSDLAEGTNQYHTTSRARAASVLNTLSGSETDQAPSVASVNTGLSGKASTSHASTHQSGGADAIKLDDLATPDDNTDLDASTARHGLLRKLSNVATEILNGAGSWVTGVWLNVVQAWTKQQYFGTATLTDAANIAWNLDDAQIAQVTLGGNRTLDNPTNMKNGGTYTLRILQDGTGGRTLSFGTAYRWPNNVDPVISTGANAVDYISFICTGTHMDGVHQPNFQ